MDWNSKSHHSSTFSKDLAVGSNSLPQNVVYVFGQPSGAHGPRPFQNQIENLVFSHIAIDFQPIGPLQPSRTKSERKLRIQNGF